MSISERLKKLIDQEFKSERSFARQVDVNPKTINNIINNANSPNYSVIQRILSSLPNLSAEWLCRGVEPMWNNHGTQNQLMDNAKHKVEKKTGQKIDIDTTIRDLLGEVKTLRQEVDDMKKKK